MPALEVLDAVSRGTVQMGHDSAYYHRGKIPAAQYFTAIPFGHTVHEMNAWMYYGGGLDVTRFHSNVSKDAVSQHPFGEPHCFGRRIAGLHRYKCEQAWPDRADYRAIHCNTGLGHTLYQGDHDYTFLLPPSYRR